MGRVAAGLIGRERELEQICALLEQTPLSTVTGPAGVGKTRLAMVAADVVGDSGRRVDTCELGSVNDPGAVPGEVADALGYPSLDAAEIGIGDHDLLLVIDSCEHVRDAAANVVERLIERCAGLRVLATSREPLDLPLEYVVTLDTLGLPSDTVSSADSPAVQLFLARAAAVGAHVSLDADAETIVELCRRLDGLPLAIELAAARMRSLTPREVLEHLGRELGLLSRDRARDPQRHHSLETAIAWSYDRLPSATQQFFDRLGMFAGRFTADTAHAVAAGPDEDLLDTVRLLDRLVTQSLVTTEQREGRTWYGLLGTLRSYARTRLAERGETDQVRDRWVASLVTAAVETRQRMLQTWPADLFVTLQNMHNDVDSALRWCIEHDDQPDRALPLFVPLCGLLKKRSAFPVAELGDLLLDKWPEETPGRWAEAAAAASVAHVLRGSDERGSTLARRAIGHAASGLAEVNARRALYFHDRMAGRDERALIWVDEAIEQAIAHDMTPWHNELQSFRAIALASLGRLDEALTQVGVAYRSAPRMGSPALEAWAASIQACLIALRDPVAGRATLEQAAVHCEELDYPIGAGVSLRALGALAFLDGRHAEAAATLTRALDAYAGIGYASELQVTLRWIARLTLRAGSDATVVATLWRSAGSVRGDVVEDVLAPDGLDRDIDHIVAKATNTARPARLPLTDAVSLARRELAVVRHAPITRAPGGGGTAGVAQGSGTDETEDRASSPNTFRLEGAVWTLSFASSTVRLPDLKGLHDLAVLLARPGREVHCTELMGALVEQPDTGPMLDEQARREYHQRVIELQEDLAEAEDNHDSGRAERASVEMELLLGQLAAASGLGGRSRRSGSGASRVRSAVTWRIRSAIKRIDSTHPELGAHLRATIQTGVWCAYRPDPVPAWDV